MSGPRAGNAAGPARIQRGWWFDDAVAGGTIAHPGGRTITADEHARLAWLTDNASDVHGDAHRAARTSFGEPLVLGALSAAIVVGLAAPATGRPEDAARGLETGWERVDLVGLVLAGDTLRAVSRVRDVTPDADGAAASSPGRSRVATSATSSSSVSRRCAGSRCAPRTTDC